MLNFACIHASHILVLSGPIVKFHYFNEFTTFTLYSQGPLYLLFVSLMTGIKINWKKYFYIHALPFIPGILFGISFLFKTDPEIKNYYDAALVKQPLDMTLLTSLAAIQMAVYLIWSVLLLNRYNSLNKNKNNKELLELIWLKNLTITLFIVVFIIAPIVIVLSKDDITVLMVFFPVMTLLIYAVIFYKSINFPGAEEEKKLIMQYEREKISRDLHDDLGSGLSKIFILSNTLTEQFKHEKTVSEQINKIASASQDLLNNMSHIVWAVNSENDSIDNLVSYISEYSIDFLESCNIKHHLELPENSLDSNLLPMQRKDFFLATKESLNNIAKHASASNVWITISVNPTELIVIIKDDGKGFINDDRQTGNGLRNIKDRLERIGGKYKINSFIGEGTTSRLSVSIT